MLRNGKMLFDKYGLPAIPTDFMTLGYMSRKRVADMLPLDIDLEKTRKQLKDL